MAKSKPLTPQEIYKQRKQREENERTAYLPPGLINHGNTCFMNSVLQGLIATRLLSDLVHFNPIPPEIQRRAATPILSRRSPQLTNGHNIAGPYEHPWVNSMPIGDVFLTVLYKAWDSQMYRKKDVHSPRSILSTLGRKYDQYLDFAQQDAHEFLRILLDAMRMEEQDIIKKRQPPKKRRRTTIVPSISNYKIPAPHSHSSSHSSNANDDRTTNPNPEHQAPPNYPLLSFVDMIFGGQLTSILVCQKCKRVSQTYEDFNDISLSIKAEDYFPHNRKRDRFKKIVDKLTAFQPGQAKESSKSSTSAHSPQPLGYVHAVEMQRSSSVPPSPRTERAVSQLGGEHEDSPVVEPPRRRSVDVVRVDAVHDAEPSSDSVDVTLELQPPSPADVGSDLLQATIPPDDNTIEVKINGEEGSSDPKEKHVGFLEPKKTRKEREEGSSDAKEKEKDKEKSHKGDDGWAKIGRRLSMRVGLGKPKGDKKDRDRKSRSMERGGLGGLLEGVVPESMQKSLSANAGVGATQPLLSDLGAGKKRVSSDGAIPLLAADSSSVAVQSSSSSSSKSSFKPSWSTLSNASTSVSQPSTSQTTLTSASTSLFPTVQRSKSPKPPKPSAAESEYLRKILADISTTPSSSNPFAIFKPPLLQNHATYTMSSSGGMGSGVPEKSAGPAWLNLGKNPSGLEECLRLFTAVEILDGENRVGCRRCWKIQNGQYRVPKEKNEDSDQEDQEEEPPSPPSSPFLARSLPTNNYGGQFVVTQPFSQPPPIAPTPIRPTPAPILPLDFSHLPSSASTPVIPLFAHDRPPLNLNMSEPNRIQVVAGEDDGNQSSGESGLASSLASSISSLSPPGPGGRPIPVISTTAPTDTLDHLTTPDSSSSATPALEGEMDSNSLLSYAQLTSNEATPTPLTITTTSTNTLTQTHPRLVGLAEALAWDSSSSKDSLLLIPKTKYQKTKPKSLRLQMQTHSQSETTTAENTENDSSDDESDASIGTSMSADSLLGVGVESASMSALNGSAVPLPSTSSSPPPPPQQQQVESVLASEFWNIYQQSTPIPTEQPKKPSKPPKPVMMRPAYKRYLISTPPPVLVIHLKRFQQTSKIPLMSMSFSHGFKKLDDYVSFPEYLDLMPFLAPRKEDYGLGKKGKGKERERAGEKAKAKLGEAGSKEKEEKCMYRLYAVVVHIGNMLGGHYIAYAALPATPPKATSSKTAVPGSSNDTAQPADGNTCTGTADSSSSPSTTTSDATAGGEREKEKDAQEQSKSGERQWAYISDTVVRLTTLEEVLRAKAYMCMYEQC